MVKMNEKSRTFLKINLPSLPLSQTEDCRDVLDPYPVMYRGISPFESKSGQALAEQYMFGELFDGQYYAYGRGTYFSPDYEVVKTNYVAQEDSVIYYWILWENMLH